MTTAFRHIGVVADRGHLGFELALVDHFLRELRAEDVLGDLEPVEGFAPHVLAHFTPLYVVTLLHELSQELPMIFGSTMAEVAHEDGLGHVP